MIDVDIESCPGFLERIGIELVVEKLENSAGGENFRALKEIVDAGDNKGDVGFLERFDESMGFFPFAQEDDHIGIVEAAGSLVFFVDKLDAAQVVDLVDNELVFFVHVIELIVEDIAALVLLKAFGFHFLGQTYGVIFDAGERDVDDGVGGAKIVVEDNGMDIRISLLKILDVLDAAAAPLENGLIVIADNADVGAEVVKLPDDLFLDGIDVLIFINNEIADITLDFSAKVGILLHGLQGARHDHGEIKITMFGEVGLVLLQRSKKFLRDLGSIGKISLAEDAHKGDKEFRIFIAFHVELSHADFVVIAVEKELEFNFVEDREFLIFIFVVAEDVETPGVDGADVHVGESASFRTFFAAEFEDAGLEFAGGFFGICERDYM